MTSPVWGADVAALRELADTAQQAGEGLTAATTDIDRALSRVPWRGPSADHFRAQWHGPLRAHVTSAAATLSDVAGRLRGNAEAQETTSRDDGSPSRAPLSAATGTGGAGVVGAPPTLVAGFPVAAGGHPGADDGSRESQRQDSRRNVGDGGTGTSDPAWSGLSDPAYGTPGPAAFPGTGLGAGVPGTSVTVPEPAAWQARDLGSDEFGPAWNTEDASFGDHAKEWAVQQAADWMTPAWPDAARNLHHYLDNSGDTLTQPVDTMLDEIPDLSAKGGDHERKLAAEAVAAARAAGATGPVNTGWEGTQATEGNWFYATGSFDYNLTGQVTVHPPAAAGGEWRYEMETTVNTRDRYNWDGTKSTQILWFEVTDRELQEFHRAGLAREFTMVGQSSPRSTEGTTP